MKYYIRSPRNPCCARAPGLCCPMGKAAESQPLLAGATASVSSEGRAPARAENIHARARVFMRAYKSNRSQTLTPAPDAGLSPEVTLFSKCAPAQGGLCPPPRLPPGLALPVSPSPPGPAGHPRHAPQLPWWRSMFATLTALPQRHAPQLPWWRSPGSPPRGGSPSIRGGRAAAPAPTPGPGPIRSPWCRWHVTSRGAPKLPRSPPGPFPSVGSAAYRGPPSHAGFPSRKRAPPRIFRQPGPLQPEPPPQRVPALPGNFSGSPLRGSLAGATPRRSGQGLRKCRLRGILDSLAACVAPFNHRGAVRPPMAHRGPSRAVNHPPRPRQSWRGSARNLWHQLRRYLPDLARFRAFFTRFSAFLL